MGKMKNSLTCPKCGSTHWDYANVGLPDAIQCLDCGYIFPQELPKGVEGSSPNVWPFPTSLKPQKQGLPKYNPNNEQDAPI